MSDSPSLTSELDEKFERLFAIFNNDNYLAGSGMANGVSLFIQPYKIQDEVTVTKRITALRQRLCGKGREVISIDLFELAHQLASRNGQLEWLLENEKQLGSVGLAESLSDWLDLDDHLFPLLTKKFEDRWDLAFVTGCGAIFPFLWASDILSNMENITDNRPVIFFYPGAYEHQVSAGTQLRLFGKLSRKGFYRAFNLDDYIL